MKFFPSRPLFCGTITLVRRRTLPAKLILLGTTFSTLTEPDGSFSFRHLPAGEYRLIISAPGQVSGVKDVNLSAAKSMALDPVNLSSGADGNLVRNGSLALRWVTGEGFDDWTLRKPPGKLAEKTPMRDWEGEWIPLQGGVAYRLSADWKNNAADAPGSQIFLRTKAKPAYDSLPTDSAPVVPGSKEVVITGSPEAAWAQVCIRTPQPPDAVLNAVSLRAVP